MQIFEQKSATKNGISLYSTKYNISKIACAAEPLFRLKVRGERLKAGSLGLRSRRACAQVCAHARHANIIYITPSMAQSPNEHRNRSRNVHTTCRH